MAVFKCKMCGGALDITAGTTVVRCDYCDTTQTVPSADDEKKIALFTRANRLRAGNEFDKASGIYESIIADFPEEAEAYWGLVLCKYGVEYVDDPATGKKIPTCHRSSFESVMDDSNFELTLEYADAMARRVYREEAKQLEEIRKGIIEVSSKEEPYDIFICYKETDEHGDRTIDSVLAQDIYDVLTEKGYRTFFARITLEDKLGQEYEPYIFAALNTAKIMLAVGTSFEHYDAVWVKNEWSRYLKLMANDKSKHLIPCYKDIDAYDMPKEFAKLQAQDLGKVGADQDLLRGIEKILPKQKEEVVKEVVKEPVVTTNSPTIASFLKRAFMFLEDGDWNSADEYCEKVLDIEPENAQAYFGKLMAEVGARKPEHLKNCNIPFDGSNNYKKAFRFADNKLKNELTGYIKYINNRNENTRLEGIYQQATKKMAVHSEASYKEAAGLFGSISHYKDAAVLVRKCEERAEVARQEKEAARRKEKRKRRRRTAITVFLVLAFISVSIFGAITFLKRAFHISDGIVFEATEQGWAVTNYLGLQTEVTIPSEFEGEPVVAIGDYAFSRDHRAQFVNVTSITIPDSVTEIGGSAFYGCDSLTSVTIPDSVTEIGGSAFYGCTSLTSVTIGKSVTTIGASAFRECRNLSFVTIPDSVTTIGDWAFSHCESLTSVTIPDSVTTIGNCAFYCCESLASIIFEDPVGWHYDNGGWGEDPDCFTDPAAAADKLTLYYGGFYYKE